MRGAKTLSGLFIDTGPVVQIKEVFGVKHLDDDFSLTQTGAAHDSRRISDLEGEVRGAG